MSSQATSFDVGFTIIGMKFNVNFEEGFFDSNEQKEIIAFI